MQYTYTDSSKERLDKFLRIQFPDISRNQLQQHIKNKHVRVNNKNVSVHHWLHADDVIDIENTEYFKKCAPVATEFKFKPEIVHENDEYLILHKPAGMLIHPTGQGETNTLADWIIQYDKKIVSVGEDPTRPGIVHRLDKDVGGLVAITKTSESFVYLKTLFQKRKIIKKYYCLVHGSVRTDEGEITTPLKRNKATGRMIAESATDAGKAAHTKYEVIKRYINYSYLDVQILTGRTHQIRAHLFSIGHSIIGDKIYQTRDIKKRTKEDPLNRPFLFAYHLSFKDSDGETQSFTLELPDDLASFLNTIT